MQTKKNILNALKVFCLTVVFLSWRPSHKHPYYLSVCDFSVEPKYKQITLSCRMFADDLQYELLQEQKTRVNFLVQTETQKKILNDYLKKHLVLTQKAQTFAFTVIGYEVKEESVWIYAQAPLSNLQSNLTLKNTLLCNSFSGQSNIVHVRLDLLSESHKHTCAEPSHEYTFGR
jgi:hypothetical protein